MPQVRKQIFLKKDVKAYYARLDKEGGGTFTRKLASQEDVEFKTVAGRKKARSEAEINNYLQGLLTQVQPYKDTQPLNRVNILLNDAVAEWESSLTVAEGTRTHYEYSLQQFVDSLPLTKQLRDLKKTDSRPMIKACQDRGVAPNTIRSYLRAVAIFLTWAMDSGLILVAPKLETPAAERKNPRVYSQEQMDKLEDYLAHDSERKNLYRLVMALRYLGLRAGEVQHLKIEHIDLQGRTIKIQGSTLVRQNEDGDEELVKWMPKKGKEAVLPLRGKLLTFLEHDLADRGPEEVWFLDRGNGDHFRIDAHGLGKALLKPLSELKMATQAKTLHGFRASLITTLNNEGTPIKDIQAIARHSNIEVTMGYIQESFERLGDALEKL